MTKNFGLALCCLAACATAGCASVVPTAVAAASAESVTCERPPIAYWSTPIEDGADELQPPRAILRCAPQYTAEAVRLKVQGEVVVAFLLDEKGEVAGEMEVVKGLPAGLTEVALDAAKQWRFKPAIFRGEPHAARFEITFHFDFPPETEATQ